MSTLLAHSRAYVDTQIGFGNTSADMSSGQTLLNGLAVSALDPIGLFNGYYAGTLVANGTVGIVLFAAHVGIGVGATINLGGNDYTVTDTASIAGTDLGFAKLNAQVTDVDPMPVLPVPSGSKYGSHMRGLPAIWIVARSNRIQVRQVASIAATSDIGDIVALETPSAPEWNIGTGLVMGDSSSPLVTFVNGQLVLLAAAYSASTGTDISDYHDEAEAIWLSDFGVTDTYTEADLSGFENFAAGDEPPPLDDEESLDMADKTWTNGIGDGSLSGAGNWDPAGEPTSSQTADIPKGLGLVTGGTLNALSATSNANIEGGTWNCPLTWTASSTFAIYNNGATHPVFNQPVTVISAPGGGVCGGKFNKGIIFLNGTGTDCTVYGIANAPKNTMNFTLS